MDAQRLRRGALEIRAIPDTVAQVLREVPALLRSEDPDVLAWRNERTYADDADEDDWRRNGTPELEHLFESRQATIEKDLAALVPHRRSTFRLRIPEAHENAWLSGLNAARHILYISHELSPNEMDTDPASIDDAVRASVAWRIHILGWLQEVLINAADAVSGSE